MSMWQFTQQLAAPAQQQTGCVCVPRSLLHKFPEKTGIYDRTAKAQPPALTTP